jgi:FG-GAP-like repeat
MPAPIDRRARAAAFVLVAAALVTAAAPAQAETVPAGAVMRIEGRVDTSAVARFLSVHYQIEPRRIIAADIDRDGDVDVLAATDRSLLVWVNDGEGRLTSRAPARAPVLAGDTPGHAWRHRTVREQDTIQNDAPTPRMAPAAANVSPSISTQAIAPTCSSRPADRTRGGSVPRAPPLTA